MVIVESPAKARTIGKYLGKEYFVRASAGHIMDLPQRALGVDIKHEFNPTYRVIPGKEKIVKELQKEAKKVDSIFLAADPDREGEAICQHLNYLLSAEGDQEIHRVLFNEITKNAILEAFEHPSRIDQHKVEAQQARRILDRIVGYKVSPLLWQKVRKGLSAGRVQTVSVRLIVDREREIRDFVSEEYWEFKAILTGSQKPTFEAKAVRLDGEKFKVSNQEEADAVLQDLEGTDFVVRELNRKERKRRPTPPFITSKLQQEAVRKLGFTVKKTMSVAQRLYEGVELGEAGSVGLITYMRTDSTRISDLAMEEVRGYIGSEFGDSYLPGKPVHYRTKKGAQDAHEAIRPTSTLRDPETMKPYLSRDEFRLYSLIWKRFVASQMTPARFDQTEILVDAGRVEFKAVGSILKFDGFLKLYRSVDEEVAAQEEGAEGTILPDLKKGEQLKVNEIVRDQKFTQPPPRYNEASLVKALEEKGIGRPSTYQQILSVIMSRDYVAKEEKRFIPTELGEIVNDLLVDHFDDVFDYDYTAKLEQALDRIEEGQEDWVEALDKFYANFKEKLLSARQEMKNLRREEVKTDEVCDKCGHEMVIKWGKFGRFLACSDFPKCKNTRELNGAGKPADDGESKVDAGQTCDKCGREMVLRRGRYGSFLACSGYPECKTTKRIVQVNGEARPESVEQLDEKCPECSAQLVKKVGRFGEFTACGNYPNCRYIKPVQTGVTCPECEKGELVERKSRRGKVFYACDRYPDCKYVVWKKPVPEKCPECDSPFLLEKTTKKDGTVYFCGDKGCGYQRSVSEEAAVDMGVA
ncbi:MAG: type I DNA topoisomerase [Acidobacteriota bacterium]|nr:MAG: type I DNA topoisomerase [Acidobacteriota bacterium]